MTAVFTAVLVLAVVLALSPPLTPTRRVRAALGHVPRATPGAADPGPGRRTARLPEWPRRTVPAVPMTVVVQQLAALLKGGRTPARLWDELWILYSAERPAGPDTVHPPVVRSPGSSPALAPGSLSMLAAARSASMRGSPVGEAIRSAGAGHRGRTRAIRSGGAASDGDSRVWEQLAACFDIAEASGCPLADVLTRFAAQLDAEDDAEAARQTALAGPKATVRLLTWLPVLGLGLGMLLGVDPLGTLLGTPLGMAALAAGCSLTFAGRFWSARLVRAATGPPP